MIRLRLFIFKISGYLPAAGRRRVNSTNNLCLLRSVNYGLIEKAENDRTIKKIHPRIRNKIQ